MTTNTALILEALAEIQETLSTSYGRAKLILELRQRAADLRSAPQPEGEPWICPDCKHLHAPGEPCYAAPALSDPAQGGNDEEALREALAYWHVTPPTDEDMRRGELPSAFRDGWSAALAHSAGQVQRLTAECERLKQSLAMAEDAAQKGDKAREAAGAMEAGVEELTRERDKAKTIAEGAARNWAESDTAVKAICARHGIDTEGDSFGVPTMEDCVEQLSQQLFAISTALGGDPSVPVLERVKTLRTAIDDAAASQPEAQP